MELYSLLCLFFIIGAIGTFMVNGKDADAGNRKSRWLKYAVYLVLVFGQLLLIGMKSYFIFSIPVVAVAVYEMNKIRKTGLSCLPVFMAAGVLYILFFLQCPLKMQQFVFIAVITFDGYSQLFGQLFGKVKLFPEVSPGKTVEGLAGGVISIVFTVLALARILDIDIAAAMIYGVAIIILSVSGDFLASLYKRANGVKDFSALIPGHGGILDRFDSLVFSGFGFYFLMKIDFSNPGIITVCAYITIFLFLFLLAETGYHCFRLKTEITRKFVHFSSGITCLSFPFFIRDHWIVLFLCSSFLLLLIFSMRFKLLKSVNDIDRKSFGSLLFPVSVYACFLCFEYFGNQHLYFYLPIIILAICDPLAALAGKKWAYGKYTSGKSHKTMMGSAVFFISCFTIMGFSMLYFSGP